MVTSTSSTVPLPALTSSVAKRQRYDLSRESDRLAHLFSTIFSFLSSPARSHWRPDRIAEQLSREHSYLELFHYTSLATIKEQFQLFLTTAAHVAPQHKRVEETLTRLYHTALLNSALTTKMEHIAQELPQLKQEVRGNLKKKLRLLITEGQELVARLEQNDPPTCHPQRIHELDTMLYRLEHYRQLKHYMDAEENERIHDLEQLLEDTQQERTYPTILKDYPKIVTKLQSVSEELDMLSFLLRRLHEQKQRLCFIHCTVRQKKEPSISLQQRFLLSFSTPLYEAFAEIFWHLIWRGQANPKIASVLQLFPSWKEVSEAHCDFALVNQLWDAFFPDNDWDHNLLTLIFKMPKESMQALGIELQDLSKQIEELRLSTEVEIEVKKSLLSHFSSEMKSLCQKALTPYCQSIEDLSL